MYQEQPIFIPPPDDATLWRYMDFTKFVSLLDRQALFFSRADRLGDPFEGSISLVNVTERPVWYRELYPDYSDEDIAQMMRGIGSGLRGIRQHVLANCWHESRLESDFMWKLYAKDNYGVAIMASFESLKRCFTCEAPIHIGQVQYVDYAKTFIPENFVFFPCLHKRESFKPEREVRAMTLSETNAPVENPPGIYYGVDLPILIEKVFVAPYAEDWFMELVQSVAKRYGLNASICRSALADEPVWG